MATPDKLTLAERMALARERTVEARDARTAAKAGRLHPAPAVHTAPASPAAPTLAPAPAPARAPTLPMTLAPATASTATQHTELASAPGSTLAPRARALGGPVVKTAARTVTPPQGHKGGGWQVHGRPGEHLNLMPGQMHFGGHVASLRTLLGSCVAVTIWHPVRKLGGMCHFLLPARTRKPGDELDGRYGDEALEAMVNLLRAAGTSPSDYQAHLCGGADTMPEGSGMKFNVGERNIEQGFSLVDRYGFEIQGVDVGEDVPRNVSLVLATGEVDMRRGKGRAPELDMAGAAAVRR